MTILHSQCLATELVKTANAIAINSVAGPVTGVIPPVSAPASGASSWYIDTSTTPDNLYFWNGSVWSLAGDGTSALLTQDEGVALGTTSTMNFVGGGVTATYSAGVTTVSVGAGSVAYATNAEAQAGTSAVLSINPANLYARENIAAQTGLANDPTTIPAPGAGQSPWGSNLLGETLHYAPNLGWKIVGDRYSAVVSQGANINLPYQTLVTLMMLVAPRDGTILITGSCTIGATDGSMSTSGGHILVNGAFVGLLGSETPSSILVNQVQYREFSGALGSYSVTAGDVITVAAVAAFIAPATAASLTGAEHLAITYTK